MASERTDVVRVSYVRTAAVSATLGALLGLAAGYLLWGLEQETPAVLVPDGDAPSATPVPNEAPAEQPKPATAVAADAGPDRVPPTDAAGAISPAPPVKKPVPRRRRR